MHATSTFKGLATFGAAFLAIQHPTLCSWTSVATGSHACRIECVCTGHFGTFCEIRLVKAKICRRLLTLTLLS